MRYPSGTPSDGDVPVYRSSDELAHWEAQAGGGGTSADIQNQLNALALGQGVVLPLMPSYDNVGGQGDRTGLGITVSANYPGASLLTKLINGVYSDSPTVPGISGSVSTYYLRFEFPLPVIITEFSFDMGPNPGNGNWKIQGSQDGTAWADLTSSLAFETPSGTGSAGGSTHATRTNQWVVPIAAPYAWKYYQYRGVSGSAGSPYINEVEFEILGLE